MATCQRLLELADLGFCQRIDERPEPAQGVSLIGIDPEPYIGARLSHGFHTCDVEFQLTGEFDLERLCSGEFTRARGHDRRVLRTEREGRYQGLRRIESGQLPHRLPRAPRVELPQRAIERIARTSRREKLLH